MIVKLKEITKVYKFKKKQLVALNKLSYEVRDGEIYGLLGPNGSGKTTSINCLFSLLEFDSGEVTIFDEKMAPKRYDIKAKIGLVPQEIAVFDELSVEENIDFFGGLYIDDKQKRIKYVEEALDFVALRDFKDYLPKKLSGGLLRRLNIACGIVHKPKLLILDEPTVGVDPHSRNLILEGILKLNKEGVTVIYTSHYMEEVEQICNYICILDKGQVIASGTKEYLKSLINFGETIHVEFNEISEETFNSIKELPGIQEIFLKQKELVIRTIKESTLLVDILSFLNQKAIPYKRIYSELPTLNDVFLYLTGKGLRD